ncbi:MAG: efflux RND transporter periplasmic adaptor subunit [Woeseia sp.]
MNTNRKSLRTYLVMYAVVLLVAIAGSSLAGCNVGEAKSAKSITAESTTALPVETTTSYRSDIYATYETTAAIGADAEAVVSARVRGEVAELHIEEGESVTEGQLLARLDGERLRIEVRQAKARLEMSTREYERLGRLQERGLVSTAVVESLKFELDALKAAYDLIRLEYSYTSIRAPIAGVVSSRDVKLGTQVAPGTSLFRITGTSRLVAYLLIPQSELSRISAGNEALVTVDALPEQTIRARIARISPTVDMRNGTFRVTAHIDNNDGRLAPGMFGRFSIAWEKHANAVLLPSAAILREDNDNIVYVVDGGTASRRSVTLGIESLGQVQILDGIDENEVVVLSGQGGLRDGVKVLARSDSGENTAG